MGADKAEVDALRARVDWALAVRRPRLSKARVEALAGMGVGALSVLGRSGGRLVNVTTYRRLAAALGVRAAWLLLGEGPAWWAVRGATGWLVEEAYRRPVRFLHLRAARVAARSRGGVVVAVKRR